MKLFILKESSDADLGVCERFGGELAGVLRGGSTFVCCRDTASGELECLEKRANDPSRE